jgi:hypothetical protein
MKHALVTPLLKKPSLDPEELSNYRLVSNFSYLSKIIERVAQIHEHFLVNSILSVHQSAYRLNHSTETAFLCIIEDLLVAADRGDGAALLHFGSKRCVRHYRSYDLDAETFTSL